MIDISIITVTYNSERDIEACLQSLLMQQAVNFEIIVIDNNSQDNTLTLLQKFKAQITIIEGKDNLGFGKGCNKAATFATGKYLYFFNPDARLEKSSDLATQFAYMQHHPEFGIVGAALNNMDGTRRHGPKIFYPGQRKLLTPLPSLPGDICWVIGASLLIRRELFALLNGFDEDYFLYGEETDLCLRARKAGYAIGFVEAVNVAHAGSASERKNSVASMWERKKNGLYLFYQKHYALEDQRRLVERERNKAKRRVWRLRLQMFLQRNNTKAVAKYQRYKTVIAMANKFLDKQHSD